MTVTAWNESVASRSLEIETGQAFRYVRSFTVQVDDPSTPLVEIASAPGVNLRAQHPEDAESVALRFSVKPRGSSMLLYDVTVNYDKPTLADEGRNEASMLPGGAVALPTTVWSGGSSLEAAPLTVDKDNKPVTNSAGVPFPDAEMKVPVKTLTCVKPYLTYVSMEADADKIVGFCNAGGWANGAEYEWLCTARRWSWKSEGAGVKYIECTYEFSWRSGGWGQDLLDIGYMQKVDASGNPSQSGTKLGPIKGQDGKPVKEPVALNNNGIAMDPPASPTNPPKVINNGQGALPYKTVSFTPIVGNPA